MSSSEQHPSRPRRRVLPGFSTRTLHHPSFLPLYVAAGDAQPHQRDIQTAQPITPAEFFYTDPTTSCGGRIPNIVSGMLTYDCFRLNTPPPIMSTCPAPPNHPNPFRSGLHPTRDLGSPTWRAHAIRPVLQPRRAVVQLTQEEDQAITDLLKLHHQEPLQSDEHLPAAHVDSSSVVGPRVNSNYRRCWTDAELEAAHTLFSRFNRKDDGVLREQNKTAKSLSEPRPALPASVTGDCNHNNTGSTGFSSIGESGDICSKEDSSRPALEDHSASSWPPKPSRSRSDVFGDFWDMKEQALSDLEGDAVHVLLSLADILQ